MVAKRLAGLMAWTAIACGTVALGGCAGSTPPVAQSSEQPPQYALGAGDKLRVTVFGEPTMTGEYTITSAGDVSFPLLGDIAVSGKTVTALRTQLTQKLSQGYINDPRVSIEVLNYRPFYILGEIGHAGDFPYVTDLSALQAIAIAGGYTYRADRHRVFIRRAGDNAERTYVIDEGHPVWILPGDTVRVGERYF